jgi:hypothetical protein
MLSRPLVELDRDVLPEIDLSPLQLLAVAVLQQAILDATARTPTVQHPPRTRAPRRHAERVAYLREHATRWLREDREAVTFWCAVAGLDPDLVFARLQRL